MNCCRNVSDTEDVLRDACCGREWRQFLLILKGRDSVRMWYRSRIIYFSYGWLINSTFALFVCYYLNQKGVTLVWMFSITQEQESEGQV